jgi:hypothetical protein
LWGLRRKGTENVCKPAVASACPLAKLLTTTAPRMSGLFRVSTSGSHRWIRPFSDLRSRPIEVRLKGEADVRAGSQYRRLRARGSHSAAAAARSEAEIPSGRCLDDCGWKPDLLNERMLDRIADGDQGGDSAESVVVEWRASEARWRRHATCGERTIHCGDASPGALRARVTSVAGQHGAAHAGARFRPVLPVTDRGS